MIAETLGLFDISEGQKSKEFYGVQGAEASKARSRYFQGTMAILFLRVPEINASGIPTLAILRGNFVKAVLLYPIHPNLNRKSTVQ